MQAHVKTPHTKIDITGEIHPKILSVLKEVYGKKVKLEKDSDDDYVDVFETGWYKKTKAQMTPGKAMRIYRQNQKMTQKELGIKLGGISIQNISHMERGIRPISLKNAKLMAKLFHTSIEHFV